MTTIVALSDTHGAHRDLDIPAGDILIHAGDLTLTGSLEEVAEFDHFLAQLPHPHKVVIAGNHDWCFERVPEDARSLLKNAIYLQDEATVVDGLRLYGSPWQPWFFDWAFNLERGQALAEKWRLIPDDTQILITHGPPLGIGDLAMDGRRTGCEDLLRRIDKVRPALHIFGHIHEARGTWRREGTTHVNACTYGGYPPMVLRLDAL